MSKAKTDALGDLHALLAKTLAAKIKEATSERTDGEEGGDPKGFASLLNVARQFLKDNGISSDEKSDPNLLPLTQTLPFTNVDDYGLPRKDN